MPKVSVIVPFYNVEGYIEKCLDTLVNQALEDIEIIVVNDGSKDNSKLIVKRFLEKYPKKIVYLEKENGGLSDSRNYALPHAKGEYVAFLDSDDYVEKDMYEKMYEIAKKENSDMVECDFYWEYPDKKKKTKIEFPKGLRYEDVEFTYKLIPFLNKVSFLKEPCVHYVQRDGSISNTQNERNEEIFDVLEHVIEFYKENDIYDKFKNELEYVYVRYAFCSSLLRIVKIQDENLQEQLLDKTWENVNTKFPNWKQNPVLKKNKSLKDLYLKTINKTTYKIYCTILGLI